MATTLSDLELSRRAADVDDLPVDKSLVLRFQMGHPEAYDEIFARYRPLAERVCMRILGNREDAQEAVQETMLRVLRGLPVFNGRYQLQAWIARIATNVSVDMVRARGRRPQQSAGLHDLGEDAVTDAAMDPERLVEQILERERVLSILDEIPPHHREALVLREFEGRSHEEIGDALGVSPAQAKALIHRAKSTFRRAWGEERHGIAAFLPWFLIPAGLRRLSGALQTLATRAAASPVAAEATASTAEKVTAAAVAVVVAAGTVGVGAYAVQRVQRAPASPAPVHAAPAPSASPAPAVQVIAPSPAHHTPGRAVVKPEKHHSSPSVPPATTPSPTTDPSPSPGSEPSPPPVVLPGPAPAWSGAFGIDWASGDVCGCGPGVGIDSSTASGELTAETGLDIAQRFSGAALDAEGDAAWALIAGIGAHMDASGGHLNLAFSLGGADAAHGYSGYASSASSVTGVPGDGNPVVYSFSGSYVLEGGDPSTSPIRTSGQFLVQVSVWGDGTSVFVTQMQVL